MLSHRENSGLIDIRMDKKHIIMLAAYAIGLTLPLWYLLYELWPDNPDRYTHAMLMKNISQQFWEGDFYPRWLMYTNAGLGSIAALLHPPLPSFLGIPLQWLAPYDSYGFGRCLVVASFVIFLSGVFCYYWLRYYFSKDQSIYGALVYISFPLITYRLYNSFALPSICGMMIFPFFLIVSTRLSKHPVSAIPTYALAQAILIFAHLPSALMFSGVAWLHTIVSSERSKRNMVFVSVSFAALLGVLLGAIYWLPVWFNKPYILHEIFVSSGRDFRNNFISLISNKGPLKSLAQMSNLAAVIVPFTFCVWQMRRESIFTPNKPLIILWLMVYLGSVLMFSQLSLSLWEAIPVLHNLQFPSRFLAVCMPAIVFMVANWMPRLSERSMFFVVSVIFTIVWVQAAVVLTHTKNLQSYQEKILKYQLSPGGEFVSTPWMKEAGIADTTRLEKNLIFMPKFTTVSGRVNVMNIQQAPRSFAFRANVQSVRAVIALKRFYYPGWQISKLVAHNTVSAKDYSLIDVVKNYKYAHSSLNDVSNDPLDLVNGKPIPTKQDIIANYYIEPITDMALLLQKHYHYPQWVLNFKGIVITQHKGLLAVELPRGRYDVELAQPWFPGEKIAASLSGVAFAIMVLWSGIAYFFFKKTIPNGAKQ